MAPPRRIDSLQAGRAAAALAVVVHHAAQAAALSGGPFAFAGLFDLGYLGVDFFFVLSGFIIYHSCRGKNLRAFAASRIRRVYLPYLPVGIAAALLYSAIPRIMAPRHDWSWLATLTLLPVNAGTALSVAWTLKHEMFFYALFALCFFTGRLAIGMAAWVAVIVIAKVASVDAVPVALINLEFVMGIVVAIALRKGHGSRWWLLASAAAFAAWLALGAGRALSPIVGLSFACAILPIVRLERDGKLAVPGWSVLAGSASYAIYLTHLFVIMALGHFVRSAPLLLGLGLLLSIAVGLLYHWRVEQPLLRMAMPGSARLANIRRALAGPGAVLRSPLPAESLE